jgi:hypothetical protein
VRVACAIFTVPRESNLAYAQYGMFDAVSLSRNTLQDDPLWNRLFAAA